MEITGLGYFTKRAHAAHTQQLGWLGAETVLQTTARGQTLILHKSVRKDTQTSFL